MSSNEFKSEFKVKKFGFSDVEIRHVCVGKKFCVPSGLILFYRCIATIYWIVVVVLSILVQSSSPIWLIYLSNWGLIIITLYFVVISFLTGYHGLMRQRFNEISPKDTNGVENSVNRITDESTSALERKTLRIVVVIASVLMEMSIVSSIIIVLIYWIFLLDNVSEHPPRELFTTISVHAVNLLLLLIDFTFHQIPVHILHFVYPFVVGLAYIVLSVVYSFTNKTPVYPILDWYNSPSTAAGYAVATLTAIVVFQFLLYGLHRLKISCYKLP